MLVMVLIQLLVEKLVFLLVADLGLLVFELELELGLELELVKLAQLL